MNYRSFVLPVVFIAIFSSCGYKGMDETTENSGQQPAFQNNAPQEQATAFPSQVADSNQIQVQQPINVNTPTNQPVANGKLNPAHGAPGHRCDIAVGAPLNSPPSQQVNTNQAVPQIVSPSQSNSIAQPAPQKVAPGMNPEHGQPGHRCDISVGAPLNSPKPANPTPVPFITDTTKN